MVKTPRREVFDPNRDFVVRGQRKIAGTRYNTGDPFDKKRVSTRRLRQMYDNRFVAMAPERPPEKEVIRIRPVKSRKSKPKETETKAAPKKKTEESGGLPPKLDALHFFSLKKEIKDLTGVAPNNKKEAIKLYNKHKSKGS